MLKGVLLSISASSLFGLVYYYPVLLSSLSVVDIFCWRLLMSLPAIIAIITLGKQWHIVKAVLIRIRKQPLFLLGLLFSSFLIGIQMLLFVWAPLNGHGLSASLGYFLLPLTMVLCGQLVYKEKLTLLQKIAVGIAILGVTTQFYMTGAFSWETAVIALGYPLYFVVRRKLQIENIAGTLFDFLFIAIGALLYFLCCYDIARIANDLLTFPIFIPLLGAITAVAYAIYFMARRLLPLGLFGLLGYVEPILLTLVSLLFLHEKIAPEYFISYGLIWLSVMVLALEGIIFMFKAVKRGITY